MGNTQRTAMTDSSGQAFVARLQEHGWIGTRRRPSSAGNRRGDPMAAGPACSGWLARRRLSVGFQERLATFSVHWDASAAGAILPLASGGELDLPS
jgi:hypothetical protein